MRAMLQSKHIIKRSYTMQHQWALPLLAERNLCLKSYELPIIGRGAGAVKTTLADEKTCIKIYGLHHLIQFLLPSI